MESDEKKYKILLLKLRDMRRISTWTKQVAKWLFLHSERCASVLWQWFCWWSGVALPRQGINVMRTSWTYPKFYPANGDKYIQIPPCRACSIQGASLPYLKFFPSPHPKPQDQNSSSVLARLPTWIEYSGFFQSILLKVILDFLCPIAKNEHESAWCSLEGRSFASVKTLWELVRLRELIVHVQYSITTISVKCSTLLRRSILSKTDSGFELRNR